MDLKFFKENSWIVDQNCALIQVELLEKTSASYTSNERYKCKIISILGKCTYREIGNTIWTNKENIISGEKITEIPELIRTQFEKIDKYGLDINEKWETVIENKEFVLSKFWEIRGYVSVSNLNLL